MAQAVADIDPIQGRAVLIEGEPDFHAITEAVATPVEWKPPLGWYLFLAVSMAFLGLFGVSIAWLLTAVFGWFAILFTGSYPPGLYRFAVGYLRWSLRFEGYLLLVRDEYPPFSLD